MPPPQCDQMVRLFVQFLAIYNSENLPSCKKMGNAGTIFCQKLSKSAKSCQRLLQLHQSGRNFAKSGNTAALPL